MRCKLLSNIFLVVSNTPLKEMCWCLPCWNIASVYVLVLTMIPHQKARVTVLPRVSYITMYEAEP